MSIKLFNPNEKPYGHLSNNYSYPIKIDNETWNNITQYIYTNMTPFLYRDKVKKNKNVYKAFKYYIRKTEIDIISDSLLTSLKVKFENPKILDVLLQTGNKDILYISDNDVLGVGKNNIGMNMLGKYLVQIRNEARNKERLQKEIRLKKDLLYEAFKAEMALNFAIRDGDDLNDYFGLSLTGIINKYGYSKIMKNIPNQQTFNRLYNIEDEIKPEYIEQNNKILNLAIQYPDILVYKTRKEQLRMLASLKQSNLDQKIFNIYIDNFIKRNYPNLSSDEYEKIKKEKFNKLSFDEKEKIFNRIKNLRYVENNPVSKSIKLLVDSTYIPSDKEIEEAENFNIIYTSAYGEPKVSKLFEKENIIETEKYTQRSFVASEDFSPRLNPKYLVYKRKIIEKPVSPTYEKTSEEKQNIKKFMEEFDEKSYDSDSSGKSSSSGYSISSESESESEESEEPEEPEEDKLETLQDEKTEEPLILEKYKVYYHSYDDNNNSVDILLFNTIDKTYTSINFKDKKEFTKFFSKIDKTSDLINILKEISEYKIYKYSQGQPKGILKIYPDIYNAKNIENIKADYYNVNMLSPSMYTGMLKINNLDYPSVSHYLITKLFTLIPEINNVKNARKYTLVDPSIDPILPLSDWLNLKDIYIYYQYEYYKSYSKRIQEFARKGLDEKFLTDYKLQELLISTSEKEIVWMGRDNILGMAEMNIYSIDNIEKGEKVSNINFIKKIQNNTYRSNGQNFVGKYLMELRENFSVLKDIEKVRIVSIKNFSDIEEESFIKNWMGMRSNDMCKTILKSIPYINDKYNTKLNIYDKEKTKFVTSNYLFEIVINEIYNSCNYIPIDIENDNIPISFIQMVRKNIKNNKDIVVTEFLWKRILSLLEIIIKNTKNPSLFNVKLLLTNIETLLSKKNNCLEIVKADNNINCIISAIINIIVRLKNIHKKIKKFAYIQDFRYTKEDIEYACSIILNTDKLIKLKHTATAMEIDFLIKEQEAKEEEDAEEEEDEEEKDYLDQDNIDIQGDEDVYEYEEEIPEDKDEDSEAEMEGYEDDFESDYEGFESEGDEGDYDGSDDNILTDDKFNQYRADIVKYFNSNYLDYPIDLLVSEYILIGVNYILKYKMSKKIKTNRINFFSSLV
jgi:predicted NAD-dependent protein-ADP-ribosyltransferase YbiA (DUF1768 family)